jgi:homopolymeric O-antigen transport system ATP-binding protein
MSDIAIRVENLAKRYRIGQYEQYKALRDVLSNAIAKPWRAVATTGRGSRPHMGGESSKRYIWALKDVSFEVKRGEVLGIIGQNGAGKSTLLKILSRITEPTLGCVQMRGRLASLLEVGTGFHPELTGAENIYLNGAMLGMARQETKRKFDEIVAFAEVAEFIDTPVKHYSSGMYLRLAFAVAAHLEPEILLVDEVLAVGDASFQKKCLGKMGEVANQGRTIIFVSHNLGAIQQLTQTSILLQHGQLVAMGPSAEIIDQYLTSAIERSHTVYELEQAPRKYPELGREVEFLRLTFEDYPSAIIPADADLSIRITARSKETVKRFRFSVTIFKTDGTPIGNVFGPEVHSMERGEVAEFRMELHDLGLAKGTYYCALAAGKGNELEERIEFDIVVEVLYFEVLAPLRADGTISEWFSGWGAVRFKKPTVTKLPGAPSIIDEEEDS